MDSNGSSVTYERRATRMSCSPPRNKGGRLIYVRAAMDENRSMALACPSRKACQESLAVKDSHVQELRKRFHRIIFKARNNILFDQGGTCDKVLEARINIQRKKDLQMKRAAAREAVEKIVKTVDINDQNNTEEEFLKLLHWKPTSEQKEIDLEEGEIVAD